MMKMNQTNTVRQSHSRITVKPGSGALGAEILGVDLSQPMDDALFAEILQAFHDNIVIFFRNQKITPALHVAFTERFGQVEPPPPGSRALKPCGKKCYGTGDP